MIFSREEEERIQEYNTPVVKQNSRNIFILLGNTNFLGTSYAEGKIYLKEYLVSPHTACKAICRGYNFTGMPRETRAPG